MKFRTFTIPLLFLLIALVSGFSTFYPNGAPAAKTGSPGDGANCTECHGGTATTTAGLITTNIPASGYVPGQTYSITANNTLTGSGKYGFEVSPQNAAGTQLGTLAAGSGSKLVGGTKYVTHSNANSTTHTWTFNWTAPAAGTGDVTFYGAFARNKPGPVTLSTLTVQEAASAPGAAGPIAGQTSVCLNTTANYSIAAVSGATSYTWTAPAGANIVSGQGTLAVSIEFTASAVSGNVSVYGSNSNGNGAASNLGITVNAPPAVPSTPSGPASVDIRLNTSSNFTTTGNAASYHWQLSPAAAGSISGTTATATVQWNASFTGQVSVSVSGINGCGESSFSQSFLVDVFNSTSVQLEEQTLDIQQYADNRLIINNHSGVNGGIARIYDLTGRAVSPAIQLHEGENIIETNVTGILIVKAQVGKHQLCEKIYR